MLDIYFLFLPRDLLGGTYSEVPVSFFLDSSSDFPPSLSSSSKLSVLSLDSSSSSSGTPVDFCLDSRPRSSLSFAFFEFRTATNWKKGIILWVNGFVSKNHLATERTINSCRKWMYHVQTLAYISDSNSAFSLLSSSFWDKHFSASSFRLSNESVFRTTSSYISNKKPM